MLDEEELLDDLAVLHALSKPKILPIVSSTPTAAKIAPPEVSESNKPTKAKKKVVSKKKATKKKAPLLPNKKEELSSSESDEEEGRRKRR
jgi:hypothetical protein